jgi:hypothetical protein
MNRGATIVFAPNWLVPGPIPDQSGGGSHRFATDCTTGRTVSGRRGRDSDLCSASGGWGIEREIPCIERDDGPPSLESSLRSIGIRSIS